RGAGRRRRASPPPAGVVGLGAERGRARRRGRVRGPARRRLRAARGRARRRRHQRRQLYRRRVHLSDRDAFSVTAARTRAFNASSSIFSPSWKSMARLVLPSRLELKMPDGSSSSAPLEKVIFTTFLYVSPVQINPS